ncbi:DUF6480 family protein [Nocardia transvalensis]|uniref:DUF6480 family protein n=1 Tax=Nocardia transvalensis TaxID=37333 RepID=UPI001893A7F6|nr:DUF6480 family protein [Nocardia transvalensis]MBF6327805.1 hypothetical protein [Nocardia transvalensis]
MAMDPDPARIPDLESGGGVRPGSTPPETPQTSGLSAPEPRTRHHFPPTGVGMIAAAAVLVVVFVVVAVILLLQL